MPEVGVLNLTIHDDSKQAADGLNSLAGALIKCQQALGDGLKLSGVSRPLNTFAKAVQDSSKTLSNIGTFLNAVSSYTKAFKDADKVTFNAQPIKDLKDAIGDGIKIGQAGTQINKIKEALGGKWDVENAVSARDAMIAIAEGSKAVAASNMGASAKNVSKLASALNEYANASLNLKSALGDGRAYAGLENMTGDRPLGTGRLKPNLQLHGGGSDVEEVGHEIRQAASEYKNYNAKIAQEISDLMKQLESFGSPKGKSLQGIVDVMTGVARGRSGGGLINASNTMFTPIEEVSESFHHVQAATEGTISIFDSATGAYKEMFADCTQLAESAEKVTENVQMMNQSVAEGISLESMPASGKNGLFANANEEFKYLTGQIEKERASMQQYFDIALKAENQLKYGGPRNKEDLQFDLKHGTEGYEQAIAAEERYQESLRELMVYVQQTASEMRSAVTDAHETPIEAATAQINEAMGAMASSNAPEAVREKIESIGTGATESMSKIELLRNKIEELKSSYKMISEAPAILFGGADGKATALNNVALKIGQVNEQLDRLVQNAHKAQSSTQFESLKESADTLQRTYGQDMVGDLVKNYSEVDLLTIKLDGMKQALADDINQNKIDTQQIADRTIAIQNLTAKIEELKQAQSEATSETRKSGSAWKSMGTVMKAMFPTLTSMLGRFKQIVKYRALRAVLKHIAAGFSEGVQNVYEYSKAIGGSFAPAMDQAATAMQQMKNSVGAAVAPAIQALIPLLQQVVNWFITLMNYVNQFFALLAGQKSWTRALPATTEAFNKQKKAAKGAGAAIKDLLADWDELNIIQSQGGGGGGGGSGLKPEDYLKMFEEVNVFDNKVRDVVDFVKENFGEILATVGLIKTAMMGWRLGKALTDAFPLLSKLAYGFSEISTIALTVTLTDLFGKAYAQSGETGWLIADALTGAVGSSIAWGIAEKIATGSGSYMAGFTLILSGGVNIINAVEAAEQEKEAEAWMLGILGSIETGIGSGLVAAGFGAAGSVAVAAGVASAVLTLGLTAYLIIEAKKRASYRQMAYNAFAKTGKGGISPQEYMTALQTRLNELTKGAQLVIDASLGLDEHSENYESAIESLKTLNALVSGDGTLTKEDAQKFKDAWKIVIDELGEISKISYETIFAGLEEAISQGSETVKKQALELRAQALKNSAIMDGARGMLKKELEFLEAEIISGTASDETIARYKEIYDVLSKDTETGLAEFHEAIKNGAWFDFSGEEQPVQAAVDFIEGMNTDLVQPALDKVQEQYEAEIKGVNELKDQLETYHDLKYIDDKQYKELSSYYDGLIEFYTTRLEDQKKEILGSIQDAMDTVVDQSIAGYLTLDQSDEAALKSYVDNVFVPLQKAIEKAGGKVPDRLKAYIARNGESFVEASAVEMARAASRMSIYETIRDAWENGDLEEGQEPIRLALNYELDLGNQDITDLADEAKRDIVQSLQEVFQDPAEIAKQLHDVFGWSYDEIFANFDFSKFDKSDINDLTTMLEELREAESESLVTRTKMDPNANGYLMWSEYEEEIKKVTESYDGLIQKIQEYNSTTPNSADTKGMLPAGMKLTAANMTVSDVGWTPRVESVATTPVETIKTEPKDNQQDTANVANGVKSGNQDVVSELRSVVSQLQKLLSKEWTVNVSPNSDWGNHNAKSAEASETVWGN